LILSVIVEEAIVELRKTYRSNRASGVGVCQGASPATPGHHHQALAQQRSTTALRNAAHIGRWRVPELSIMDDARQPR